MIDRSNLASRCLCKHRINKWQFFVLQNDHFQAIRLRFLAKRSRVTIQAVQICQVLSKHLEVQRPPHPVDQASSFNLVAFCAVDVRHVMMICLLFCARKHHLSWWQLLQCWNAESYKAFRNNQSAKTLVIFCGLCSWSHWIFDFPVTVPRLALHPMVAASCVQLGLNC